MRRFSALPSFSAVVTAAALLLVNAPARAADAPLNACATQSPAFTLDDLAGFDAPCVAAPGTLLVETLYFQNASRVGGTALAAYPLFRLRTGILPRLEAVIDTPSQIAESGPHGIGLYPATHFGYGLNYTFVTNAHLASALGFELVPPSSRFTTSPTQPRYALDLTTGYHLTSRATLSAIATGTSSASAGLGRVYPALALRGAYDTSSTTQVSTDFGARVVTRRSVAQSYADVAVNQRLQKNMSFDVGLGTTFNPVSNAKAHYLASGLNLHL